MNSVIDNPRIPYELLRPILEHLEDNKASLCAISLASSACRDDAQRILFREVNLWRYTSQLKFLRTVAASPTRLALFVRAYSHSWSVDGTFTINDLMNDLPNIVQDGLKAMSRLKEMKIFLGTDIVPCSSMYIQILSACTFRLERFEWTISSRTTDDLVERFLPCQTTLRHLHLYRASFSSRLCPVPPATCPQLLSVTANWDVIKALLPGRNISTLQILEDDIPTDADINSLAAELKCIKALAIDLYYLWQMKHRLGLGAMQCFSSLIALKMHCDANEDDSMPFAYFKQPEPLNMLSQLPVLQTLVLTASHPIYEDEDGEILELMCLIFDKFSKHLRHIDIGSYVGSYSRYFRSQETVQKISRDEALKLWS